MWQACMHTQRHLHTAADAATENIICWTFNLFSRISNSLPNVALQPREKEEEKRTGEERS